MSRRRHLSAQPTLFPKVFTQGPHAMADDTRVTHPRLGFACVLALVYRAGLLPARKRPRRGHHRGPRGRPERRRAGRHPRRRRREARRHARACPNTEVVSAPAGQEAAALAALEADPDVRYAVPDVTLHTAAQLGRTRSSRASSRWRTARTRTSTPCRAWQKSQGAGVTVAIVDQDVDVNHPGSGGRHRPGRRSGLHAARRLHGRRPDGSGRSRDLHRRHRRRPPRQRDRDRRASRPSPTCCRCARSTTAARGT